MVNPNQVPSVGRVVHYTPSLGDVAGGMRVIDGQHVAALVCFIHPDERYVNLAVFDAGGAHHERSVVPSTEYVAGTEGARGCWSWPAYVPPKAAEGPKSEG